jgi:hypothetical protein
MRSGRNIFESVVGSPGLFVVALLAASLAPAVVIAGTEADVMNHIKSAREYPNKPDKQEGYYLAALQAARLAEDGGVLEVRVWLAGRRALPYLEVFKAPPALEAVELWYTKADRDARKLGSETYIDLLVKASVDAEAAGDWGEVRAYNSKALKVATSSKSPWAEVLGERDRGLRRHQQELRRIDHYRSSMAAGRSSETMVRAVLLWELLVEEDLKAALQAAGSLSDDDPLRQRIEQIAGAKGLEPAQMLEFAEWCEGLALDPDVRLDRAKAGALRNAVKLYESFLASYEAADTKRLIAKRSLERVEEQLAGMAGVTLSPPDEQWQNLYSKLREPTSDEDKGSLTAGKTLKLDRGVAEIYNSQFAIPVDVGADYDLRADVLLLPKARARGSFIDIYYTLGETIGGYIVLGDYPRGDRTDPFEAAHEYRFTKGETTKLLFCMRSKADGEVHLKFYVDNQLLTEWTGRAADLFAKPGKRSNQGIGANIRFGGNNYFAIGNLEIRKNAGEMPEPAEPQDP